MTQTLAEKNLNPLNLEITSPPTGWKGADPAQKAPEQSGERRGQLNRFVRFTAERWGWRAGAKNVLYHWRGGKNTIRKLIHAWCPPYDAVAGKQHTEGYVLAVSRATGLTPDQVVDFRRYDVMAPTIWAMHIVEAGKAWGKAEERDAGLADIGIAPTFLPEDGAPDAPPANAPAPAAADAVKKEADTQTIVQGAAAVGAAGTGLAAIFEKVSPLFAGIALLVVVGVAAWAIVSFLRAKRAAKEA